jgi:hypothetical protein
LAETVPMSDRDPPLTLSEASDIVADIDRLVISTEPETIMAVFRALALLDAQQIEERARCFVGITDPADLWDNRLGPDDLRHRLTMDTFQGSMAEYLVEKCPEIAPSVEHDIPTWIEANAPTVAWANLKVMESHLPVDDPQAYRSLIELHRLLDLDACEAEQTRILLDAWAAIESRIDARLAGATAGPDLR